MSQGLIVSPSSCSTDAGNNINSFCKRIKNEFNRIAEFFVKIYKQFLCVRQILPNGAQNVVFVYCKCFVMEWNVLLLLQNVTMCCTDIKESLMLVGIDFCSWIENIPELFKLMQIGAKTVQLPLLEQQWSSRPGPTKHRIYSQFCDYFWWCFENNVSIRFRHINYQSLLPYEILNDWSINSRLQSDLYQFYA